MSDWGSSVDEPKKAQEFYNLLQFIYSKKRLGLQPSVAFKWKKQKKIGALKGLGGKEFGNLNVPGLENSWLCPWSILNLRASHSKQGANCLRVAVLHFGRG